MATVYGDNYTKVLAGGTSNILDRAKVGEKVRCLPETYKADALESGSTIALAKDLKPGDIVVGGAIYYEALGASSTLTVGDSNDADRYLAVTDSSSAGGTSFNLVGGINYTIGTNDGDQTILITTGGAAITGTVKAVIFYVSN